MKMFLFISLLFLSFTQFSLAQDVAKTPKLNAMSGVFGITAEGGLTLGFTDYETQKFNYSAKASLEYYFPAAGAGNLGLRVFGQTGFISGQGALNPTNEFSTKIDMYGGGVIYALSMGDAVYPWIGAGVSNLWFYPKDANGNALPNYAAQSYTKYMLAYNGDAGVRIFVAKNMSINFAGGVIVASKDYLDDIKAGLNNDLFYTLSAGLTYYIGRESDSDGDGVPNTDDACQGTPWGVKVDEFGCPVDTDKDGVPDHLDKCSDTPAGVKVDADGCALDADGDGVPDHLDKCSNTPAGVKVNANGCPIDTDGDGVPDYLDKCSNTPAGVTVDANGCVVDSDGDGVPDSLDKCPNTSKGVEVDSHGCPLEKETIVILQPAVIESLVLSGDTNFEFNKSKLLPNAYTALDGLVITMKANPNFTWEIGGHTDGIGSDSYNKNLSRQRAQSVVDYLLSKGVERKNLHIVGYGKDNPIATNDTVEGRSMNRRVEIKVLSKDKK